MAWIKAPVYRFTPPSAGSGATWLTAAENDTTVLAAGVITPRPAGIPGAARLASSSSFRVPALRPSSRAFQAPKRERLGIQRPPVACVEIHREQIVQPAGGILVAVSREVFWTGSISAACPRS